jgi:hypothetical protein
VEPSAASGAGPGVAGVGVEHLAPPELELKTIVTVGDRRTALLAGPDGTLTVQVGERIGAERVAHIGADHVELRGPYGGRRLSFAQVGIGYATD